MGPAHDAREVELVGAGPEVAALRAAAALRNLLIRELRYAAE